MSTSRFVFMTPTRLSDQDHPHIRAFVHNLRTGLGSKIQAIKTSLYHAHVENDVTKHDTIVLGHYDEETTNYINVGEFSTMELRDWVTTDIPTYQEGNVAEYQHLTKIRNHYKYLDYVWEDFHKAVFGKTASESFRGGMIDLNCLYGFVTDNGYFLTRFQACQVSMRNGQVQSKYETSIKSYSVKKWERNPYPPSDFVLKV